MPPRDPPPASDVVSLVKELLGIDTDRALADLLWPGERDAAGKVSGWSRGDWRPNYEATMRMLDAIGALRWDVLAGEAMPEPVAEAADSKLDEAEDELLRNLVALRDSALTLLEQLDARAATRSSSPARRRAK